MIYLKLNQKAVPQVQRRTFVAWTKTRSGIFAGQIRTNMILYSFGSLTWGHLYLTTLKSKMLQLQAANSFLGI